MIRQFSFDNVSGKTSQRFKRSSSTIFSSTVTLLSKVFILLIIAVIIVDMAEIFFKGTNDRIVRDVFGCAVVGIVGMAVAAGVWYLQVKKGKSNE